MDVQDSCRECFDVNNLIPWDSISLTETPSFYLTRYSEEA